jgi:c-di-GMP-binding flagellar brake protein YcgR
MENKNHSDWQGKDRRRFPRFSLSCPVGLFTPAVGRWRKELAHSRTDNISNGGCYVTIAENPAFQPRQTLQLELNVPRRTVNTYMFEPVRTSVRIVRIEESHRSETSLALQFENPLDLQLEE